MIGGPITGAHLNPALSISLMTIRKLKPLQCISEFDGGIRQMTGSSGIQQWNALIDQIIGTAILMIFIMAVTHEFNQLMSKAAQPFAYALIVTGIMCAFSLNAGAAINPSRNLGPRLFRAFVHGWNKVFGVHGYFFCVSIIDPIVGAIVGVWLCQCFISMEKHYGHLRNIEDSDADIKIDSRATQITVNVRERNK